LYAVYGFLVSRFNKLLSSRNSKILSEKPEEKRGDAEGIGEL
jgi:hypothetical protein